MGFEKYVIRIVICEQVSAGSQTHAAREKPWNRDK